MFVPGKNSHARISDVRSIAVDFQGGVLGTREDVIVVARAAKVRQLVPAMEQELELAA